MSAWLFDLGNTRLKCAPLGADGRPGESCAFPHGDGALAPDWATGLPPRIEAAYVASVASPALRVALLDTLATRCCRISVATTRKTWQGLRIAYDEPARLGVDRFLTLLAAHGRGGAWLVVGVGTALTIDLVDADGRHHGGRIAPAPMLMRQSLQARAAQLPAAGGDYRLFAGGTLDALASGCLGAALALVEQSRVAAAQACGGPVSLLLHGGGAPELLPHLGEAACEPALVLEGLARWARVDPGHG
jgi:type III pantothenate kinase